MSIAKCISVLVILAVLFYLFIVNRRKMNQLSVTIAVTWVALSVYRLWTQRSDSDLAEQLITIGIFIGGGVLLWLVLWGGQQWSARKSGNAPKSGERPKT